MGKSNPCSMVMLAKFRVSVLKSAGHCREIVLSPGKSKSVEVTRLLVLMKEGLIIFPFRCIDEGPSFFVAEDAGAGGKPVRTEKLN